MTARELAVVVSGFPRHSETFALNELLALETMGMLGEVFATKPGDTYEPQPGFERLLGRVEVLPPLGPAEQAGLVARRLAGGCVMGLHGYFAHTPAEVAMLAAQQLGIPYGFSIHAKDVRKVAPDALTARARCRLRYRLQRRRGRRGPWTRRGATDHSPRRGRQPLSTSEAASGNAVAAPRCWPTG